MLRILAFAPVSAPNHSDALVGGVILALCLTALSVLPALLSRIWRFPSRYLEGVCGRCGYSLHGLPSAVCPECGSDTRAVGTRRTLPSPRGLWIACAAWIALLFLFNQTYWFEIDAYLLRLIWGIGEYSASSLHLIPENIKLDYIRRGTLIATMIVGIAVIRSVWRRPDRDQTPHTAAAPPVL
jgi:hypothetical protein